MTFLCVQPQVSRDGRAQSNAKLPGSLLERVFTPCTMAFQYMRHRGGQGDGKGKDARMKPLKHFHFTSPDISASMTSRQFSILMDVITSLLLARLPRWAPLKRRQLKSNCSRLLARSRVLCSEPEEDEERDRSDCAVWCLRRDGLQRCALALTQRLDKTIMP